MEKRYTLNKPEKYLGDPSNVFIRSSWEKAFIHFLEESPVIKKFNSEDVVVSYFYLLDKKWHRYYIDFYVELVTGYKYLIEIKPFHERVQPRLSQRNRRYIDLYMKNQSKWEAAVLFAEKNGVQFIILDEFDLKRIGVRIPIDSNKRKREQKMLFESTNKYGKSVEKFISSILKK